MKLRAFGAVLAAALAVPGPAAAATTLAELLTAAVWGERSAALRQHLGPAATVVAPPIDFGDSYSEVVVRNVALGGAGLIAFFQMDKQSGGLKRIQLERPRHAVSPAAFRAVLAGLQQGYGEPDRLCGVRPGPAGGYQAAAERIWQRDRIVIRAIFRDTTLEAYEGCVAGDPSLGPCGLTGQLLIRISPLGADAASCPAPPGRRGAGR